MKYLYLVCIFILVLMNIEASDKCRVLSLKGGGDHGAY